MDVSIVYYAGSLDIVHVFSGAERLKRVVYKRTKLIIIYHGFKS